MLFFANVEVVCPVCHGQRFNETVLNVKYNGRSIKEVLDLTVEEAVEFFAGQTKLIRMLEVLREAGLGYLPLGQPLTTLSGGEAQRLKLAAELIENHGGKMCIRDSAGDVHCRFGCRLSLFGNDGPVYGGYGRTKLDQRYGLLTNSNGRLCADGADHHDHSGTARRR